MNKPSLNLTPRHFWLHRRTHDCVNALMRLDIQDDKDWEKYRDQAKLIAQELLYAVTEWEKYYND